MNRIVLVHPTSLVGKELRERLENRPDLCRELHLLSNDETEVGTLTEIAGAAAFVGRLEEESFDGAGLALFCGEVGIDRPALALCPEAVPAIVLSRGAGPAEGAVAVAGVRPEGWLGRTRLVSPHPAAVALAQLLAPLAAFEVRRAVATVVMPVSVAGDAGLDELFEQTRGILAFSGNPKGKLFPAQIAFNLLPSADDAELAAESAREALGCDCPIALELVQGGVFHGLSVALHVELGTRPAAAEIRKRLGRSPGVAVAKDGRKLGPVAAAGEERLLVGEVRATGDEGGYWIWAVMDNLVRGGAANALALAERLLGAAPPA